MSLGTDNSFTTATVQPGEYATDADFAAACETALHSAINGLDYWVSQAFPKVSQTFTLTGASTDRLTITITYDPQEWNNAKVGTAASVEIRQQVFANNAGILPDFNQFL